MKRKKWEAVRNETVPLPITGDEKIWLLYSLCLMCNPHVPEYMDDSEVSEALNKMAERTPLPHGIDFHTWSPKT